MNPGPRATVDDRPSGAPEDRLGSVDGSTVSPAERDASEPPPTTQQEDPFLAPVDAGLRVVALIVAVGFVGFLGSLLAAAWVYWDTAFIWVFSVFATFLFPLLRRLWLAARQGVEPGLANDRDEIDAIESRAFLEAVERHDRLVEARRLAAEEAGGVLNAECRPEGQAPPLSESTDRGCETKIAARMKERGDPG